MKHLTSWVLGVFLVGSMVQAGPLWARTTNVNPLTSPNMSMTAPSPSNISTVTPMNTSAVGKCGVNTLSVTNECGVGAFKNLYVQCYDGYEEKHSETSSCKSSEAWREYARAVCANHCGSVAAPSAVSDEERPVRRVMPVPAVEPMPATAVPIAVCAVSDDLMKQYNTLISELQKTESRGDRTEIREITSEIVALKQEIIKDRERCQLKKVSPAEPQPAMPTVVSQGTITIDRCTEVKRWEEKTNYYKRLSELGDADLRSEYGFSGEEVNRILRELGTGVEKVRAQCTAQSNLTMEEAEEMIAVPQTFQNVTDQVKPVAAQSAEEINGYYKARLQTITGAASTAENQIRELKVLQGEKNVLTEQLIKSRKEIEATELNALEKEVTVTSGQIRAGEVTVDTTGKRVLINVGATSVSVEPTANRVIIRERIEIRTDGVSIEDNKLKVGGAEVKLLASDVADQLGITPASVELKEERTKAVYKMKVGVQRKLFGFIPLSVAKTVTADATSGNLVKESFPWYSFLTTR